MKNVRLDWWTGILVSYRLFLLSSIDVSLDRLCSTHFFPICPGSFRDHLPVYCGTFYLFHLFKGAEAEQKRSFVG